MSEPVWVLRAGTVPYEQASALQERIRATRSNGEIPDVLVLVEHPPVYTKGRRSEPSELGMGEDWYRMQGIEVCEADRGGRVTYHGPGQLVAYPIVALGPYGDDVGAYVRRLERVMIGALDDFGVPAQVFDGLTGVWTAGDPPLPSGEIGPQGTPVGAATIGAGEATARKIGSIGVHVSRGVTTHGLAVNVNNDLQPFEWIVPCGIDYVRSSSIARELGAEQDLAAFAEAIEGRFAVEFDREPQPPDAELEASLAEAGGG